MDRLRYKDIHTCSVYNTLWRVQVRKEEYLGVIIQVFALSYRYLRYHTGICVII